MDMQWVQDVRHRFGEYFPANTLRKRFAIGMSWVLSGAIFRQGANFLAGILVARLLGIADFGKLAVIQSTVLMVSSFGQAGIGLSTTKYVASTRATDPQRAGRIIGFSLAFAGISSLAVGAALIGFSKQIVAAILPGSNLSTELILAGGWISFEITNALQLRMLAGLEAFNGSAQISFYQGLFLLPLIFSGAYYGGLTGTIIAYSLVSMTGCVVGQVILRKECRRFDITIDYKRSWEERRMLRMSTMVWLSSIAMNTTNWLVGIILARQPAGLAQFALFNAANRFQNILVFLPGRIFQVSVPVLANLQAEGNRRGFTKAIISVTLLTLGVTVTGALLLMIFSDRLMSWYGEGFAQGGSVLAVVAMLCVVSSLWTVASAGLWAAEQSRQMLALDIFRAILLVALCLVGLATTAQGLAVVHLISYTIGVGLMFIVLSRYLKQPWDADDKRVRQQE